MFLFASSSFAEVPVNPHFTPMSLMPRPFAASSTFDVAGIYWLPDYLGKNISRGSSEDVGGGDIEGNCEENYGMHTPSNIDDRYTCSKYNYNVTSSLKCHVNCRCKDEYQYTSSNCSGNYTPSGTSCDGKYNACTCKSEFRYNSSNCSGEYQLSGTSCGGNYNACVCKPEFQYTSSNCSGSYTTAGASCEGKYNQCVCKSEFKYNSSNCSGEYEVSGTSCGGYYNACTIRPDCAITSKDCDYGCAATNSCGKCTECKSCTPSANETGCTYGTESCSDGCGGTRLCCKSHTHSFHCPVGSPYQEVNEWGDRAVTFPKYCDCGERSSTLVCYKAPDCGSEFVYDCEKGGGTRPEWEGATCGGLSAYCKCPEGKHWNKTTAQCEINKYEFEICTGITNYHQLGTINSLNGDLDIGVYIDGKRAGTVYGPSLYGMPSYGGGDYWHPAEPQWRCETFEVSGASTLMLEHHVFARGQDGGYSMCYAYQGVNFTWVNDNGRDYIEPQGSCEEWGMGDIGRFTINGYLTSSDDIWDGIDTIKIKIEIPYGAGDDYPCVYPSYSC